MPLLVKFEKDYSDEFNVYGFAIYDSRSLWEDHLNKVNDIFLRDEEAPEVYFGTNEFIEYNDFSEYESSFKIQEIDEETAKKLKDLFGVGHYGHFCIIEE